MTVAFQLSPNYFLISSTKWESFLTFVRMERADSKQRAAYKRALRWKANPVRAYTYHNKDGKHITYRLKPFPRDCSHLISREEVREAQKLVDAANAK